MKIRDHLPVRRKSPSKNPSGENWGEHKSDLKEDFHSHCAYCGSYDGFRHTYFEVDHFVPKVLFREVGGITDCQYDNLVYSCKFCNNKKSNKWPSGNIAIHNTKNEGFIDPCSPEFEDHFNRTPSGSIVGKTDLGRWMVTEGFKFDERDQGIRLLWNLNQLRKAIYQLKEMSGQYKEGSKEYNEIYQKMKEAALPYFFIHDELQGYYDSI